MSAELLLMGCGDVGPIHEPVDRYASLVRETLAGADLRFAQVERVYSERGALQLHSGGGHSRVPPAMASVFTDCGFDVVSLASNHAMDWGPDAMLDTAELLRSQGMQVIGAGENLAAARRPAILERNGVRVAFLAYCSILREGYAATDRQPGVAPLRAHTYYEAFDYQAGVPPRVVTVPYEDDLAAMTADIAAARREAHAVIVSLHWGIHFIPRVIADYQPVVARAAFAAGADAILGHHAHCPKAIGLHDGKACFYSLSNFIMSSTAKSPAKAAKFCREYGVELDPEYPHLAYGRDAKRSLIANLRIGVNGVREAAWRPVLIDRELRPEPLSYGDPRFDDAVRFMTDVSAGYGAAFERRGDELRIVSAAD